MLSSKLTFIFSLKLILLSSCFNNETKYITVSGNIDYVGSANITILKVPLHYKYSPKKNIQLHLIMRGILK